MHGSRVLFFVKRLLANLPSWAPLVFFGVLLLVRVSQPPEFVFDEGHYIPAAKSLIQFEDNLNFVHPPMGKWILGGFWLIFTKILGLFDEPTVFRLPVVLFALWGLWGVRGWMQALGFRTKAANAAVWLTGFNFLWFVQAKTAMLDMFCVVFGIWGLLLIYKYTLNKRGLHWGLLGWALLGFALASKWLALSFLGIGMVLCLQESEKRFFKIALGLLTLVLSYCFCFVPLAYLAQNPVTLTDLFKYHQEIISSFHTLQTGSHPYSKYWENVPRPYASHWWQWPSLERPMWYFFKDTNEGTRGIWAGGNPLLYWTALPAIVFLLFLSLKNLRKSLQDKKWKAFQVLSMLYWMPLLFWAIVPRDLQMYYYYLASSFWVAPIVVGIHEYFLEQPKYKLLLSRSRLLWTFVILCGAVFFYFLPIMDARLLPENQYQIYMWLESWI